MRQSKRIQQIDIPERKGHEAIFNASYLTDIPAQLKAWNCTRILLVVSKTLDKTTSSISNLETLLGPLVISKKSGVGQHSPYADVLDIAHRIQTHAIDCTISIGSGSYNDAAQTARLLASTLPPNFTASDMESLVNPSNGAATISEGIKAPTSKLILVPTSLSAGEWNSVSSSTNTAGKKQHFGHPAGAADLILLDPELASSSPEKLWLSSGIRAIDHCVETLTNPLCSPTCAALMEKGLRNLLKGLPAYQAGKSRGDSGGESEELLEGITECQYGARDALSGYLLYKVPFGPSHAIGHQLGSVGGVMHGVTSCIMLAPVLRYTASWNPAAQAKILGIFNEVLGWEEKSAGDAVERFVGVLGLPTRLGEVGIVREEQFESIAEKTMTDVLAKNPGHLEKKEQALEILELVR